MKKQRQSYDLDYKRRIVQEYLAGQGSAEELAKREGLVRGPICKGACSLNAVTGWPAWRRSPRPRAS